MNDNRGLWLLVVIVLLALLAIVLAGCGCALWEQPEPVSTPTLPPVVEQPSADWPMFRFSLDHSGYNATETILKPPLELKWKFKAKSKI